MADTVSLIIQTAFNFILIGIFFFTSVCYAINATIDYIDFPESVCEMRSIKLIFHQIAYLPNCIGAVDGTIIPIKGKTGPEEPAYFCRKNFHADLWMNIQAVADANMRLIIIYAFAYVNLLKKYAFFQICNRFD